MSKQENGGAAFPSLEQYSDHQVVQREDGMTLRDYFAANALVGLLKVNRPTDIGALRQEWADEAYLLADAMLKARQQ